MIFLYLAEQIELLKQVPSPSLNYRLNEINMKKLYDLQYNTIYIYIFIKKNPRKLCLP